MVKRKNSMFEIGILLSLFGIQYSRVLMELFATEVNLTNALFVFSILLIIDFRHLDRLTRLTSNRNIILILTYQVIVIIYAFLAHAPFLDGGVHASVFTFFCFVFIISLHTRRLNEFDSKKFIDYGWWTTGVFTVILAVMITNLYRRFSTLTYLPMGSDRLTLSVLAFAHLVFTLCKTKNRPVEKVCTLVFIINAIICMVLFLRKGLIISYAVILLFHLWRRYGNKITKKMVTRTVLVIGTIILLIFASQFIFPEIWNGLKNTIEQVVWVVNGFFGRDSDIIYNSGAIRNYNRINSWNDYMTNYSGIEIVLGKGYGYDNIDLPAFTAFKDLGLFGGIFYIIIQIIIPLTLIFKKTNDSAIIFFQYFSIYTIISAFYTGVSYGHYKFVPIILLAYFGTVLKKKSAKVNWGGVQLKDIFSSLFTGKTTKRERVNGYAIAFRRAVAI